MSEAVIVAIISALGGGFLGSLLQSFLLSRNADRERRFQKEQSETERKFRAAEAQREWDRKEAKRREERYFDLKLHAYLPLIKALSAAISNFENDLAVVRCLELVNDSLLFFGDDAREIVQKMEAIPCDNYEAKKMMLVKLYAILRYELDLHHVGKFEEAVCLRKIASVRSENLERY